ncbi:MAG: hypothetical protein Q9220_003514 [cf. Caloplaca sp. 1 TL-2023]
MEGIVTQIQSLAKDADKAGRKEILNKLRDVQTSLEKPMDLFLKLYNSHLQVAVVYSGIELGLFQELAKEGAGTMTVTDLAEKSGASPDLLARILRYLAAVGYVLNVGYNQFRANQMTQVLANPIAAAGLYHTFDTCSPAIQALPSFLAENNYQDITENGKTPFQKGHRTDLTGFQWLSQKPKLYNALHQLMTSLQSSEWIEGFEILGKEARSFQPQQPSKVFFVDIGGGHGHQCVQLLTKYPDLHGHLVLQDLPQAVDQLPPIRGVKTMGQDFFEKQAIEGASFYYIRRVLHDWPDVQCIKILQNLAAAMSSTSRILVDEIVLPKVDVHLPAAMADMVMGILFGGKERTEEQWRVLAQKSGLRLEHIHLYNVAQYSSIVVLAKE